MKLLLVGGGGREHALAWKFMQDDPSLDIVAAPGNPGIASIARCVNVRADDVDALLALARAENPDVTMVGPEAPLAAGIVDAFRESGFAIFGPTKAAARIETSKSYAKELMFRAGVLTARATTHTTLESALHAVAELGAPVVIKASGLAAGKGVVVAATIAEAEAAVRSMIEDSAFGEAGSEILVEEFMEGEELSLFAVCDGTDAVLLPGVQDHKRLEDGDRGPNTGGMGAYAPVSIDTPVLREAVLRQIIRPILDVMKDDSPFTGLLYAGLMLTATGPRVVEFNCRFGDPETEALLPLLDGSLLDLISTVANGGSVRHAHAPTAAPGASVTTIVASRGYPAHAHVGDTLGLPEAGASTHPSVHFFHAGTRMDHSKLVSAGGRVVAVTALAPTLGEAAAASRAAAETVELEGKQLRHDIAWRELARERSHDA